MSAVQLGLQIVKDDECAGRGFEMVEFVSIPLSALLEYRFHRSVSIWLLVPLIRQEATNGNFIAVGF